MGNFSAGVLGKPIAHSLSPVLYRAAFSALGMSDWTFEALECDADELGSLVSGSGPHWAGFAVTMPGKAAAAAFADERSERVRLMGVANTLVRRRGGWFADNTDVDGVCGSLRAAGVEPCGTVLLLGGGGTARAVLAALAELSWDGEVILAGRRETSTAAATELATALGLRARRIGIEADTVGQVASRATLVVSTVPAGAADHLAAQLASVPALFDVIYHPWPTALAAAGSADRITVTGLDMLLHQALRQFELVTRAAAPAAAMRDALRAAVGSALPLRL